MEVTFSPELERYIDEMVSRGEYPTREDVVRASVAQMRGRGEGDPEEERIRELVEKGLEAAAQGRSRNGEEVMRELRARFVRMAEEKGEAA